MTPHFTTPCYVRIEDAEKRKEICKKLEQIGYHVLKAINFPYRDTIFTNLFFADASYTNEPSYVIWKNYMVVDQLRNTHINCGTNIECFLALAGMRNDTDRNQWFIETQKNHKDKWVFCGCTKAPKSTPSKTITKATTTEIIEHLKTK